MKVIIAGSRSIADINIVIDAIHESGLRNRITEVVSGGARGVDQLGEQWAEMHSINTKRMPADWARVGRRAGFVRNREMAQYADALIAVWDGVSHGTEHMINVARECKLKVYVHEVHL